MRVANIADLGAFALARSVRRREIGAEEVLDAHLQAIERFNPHVNAFITVSGALARAQARAIDQRIARGEQVGPLAGVPIGIKDVTDTAGVRTTYGSRLFADHVPAEDAAIVARLRRADALILGKTNTPEFATGASLLGDPFGASRNPWNTDLTVGASTGGGAAALATRMIALATGTDLGGSLRVPAAFCGVLGLRPTPGLVPALPNETPFDSLDVEGLMARSARDLAVGLNVIAGPHPSYPGVPAMARPIDALRIGAEAPPGLRLAFAYDIADIGVDSEIGDLCAAAAKALAGAGHDVQEVALDLSQGRPAYVTLRGQWMVNRHFRLLDRRPEMGTVLGRSIDSGLGQHPVDLARAEAARTAVWRKTAKLFERYDALLTPTTAIPPFPVEIGHPTTLNGQPMESYIDWAAPTFLISLIGLPAVSVPCGLTRSGLPAGLQIIGPRFTEARLLGLAAAVEAQFTVGPPPLLGATSGDPISTGPSTPS